VFETSSVRSPLFHSSIIISSLWSAHRHCMIWLEGLVRSVGSAWCTVDLGEGSIDHNGSCSISPSRPHLLLFTALPLHTPLLQSTMSTVLPETKALEQTRQRLIQLSNSIASVRRELEFSDPLPDWYAFTPRRRPSHSDAPSPLLTPPPPDREHG
jgi:hypothetical protein